MRDDRLYLIDIADCIERIEEYTQTGREGFAQSRMAQDAVMRNFEIIGEAVKQMSSALKRRHPGVSWRKVAGFRDVLIHNYTGVKMEEVWRIVEHDLPKLKRTIAFMLQELDVAPPMVSPDA
jgi:uncharacterized protein with HEPN domain